MKYTFCTNYFRGFPANQQGPSQDSPSSLSPFFRFILFLGEKPYYFFIFRSFSRIFPIWILRFSPQIGRFFLRRFAQPHFFNLQIPLSFLS